MVGTTERISHDFLFPLGAFIVSLNDKMFTLKALNPQIIPHPIDVQTHLRTQTNLTHLLKKQESDQRLPENNSRAWKMTNCVQKWVFGATEPRYEEAK